MKTGLVLEGGAMRGMYTAGALDVLLENDINFDGTYFIYCALKNKNDWSGLISNLVCAGFMVSALTFMYL